MINVKKIKYRYVTNQQGQKTDVILKVKDFEELLEDLNDIAIVAERKDESTISHQEVLKDLKQHGLL